MIAYLIDLFLHLDQHLQTVTQLYGGWTYALLFVIIFCETGLVVTPFLPGDSLLFAAGALAALPNSGLNLLFLYSVLALAAIGGDTLNYVLGTRVGNTLLTMRVPLVKHVYLDKTHAFYQTYGNKTIIIARFVPIVRTFAPFVAGIGNMRYKQFMSYNVVGGMGWVALMTCAGYFFGRIAFIQRHFGLVTIAIMCISVFPLVVEVLRARRAPLPHVPAK